jgi:hypothetical protein
MPKFYVDLSKFESVKRFVELTSSKSCFCLLKSGRYTVDAKSILGIFSLDLSKPVEFEVGDGDYAMFEGFRINSEV